MTAQLKRQSHAAAQLEPSHSPAIQGGGVPTHDALARRALAGEPGAVSALLCQLLPAVKSACRALLGPGHPDLEDAVQNALIAIHRALPSYRFECSIRHYAVRITLRTNHGFRRRLRLLADRFGLVTDERDLERDRAPLAADTAVAAQRSEALRRLMTKLPRVQAEAMLLHVALDYSIAEVAEVESVSVNTIKTRLRLGKDALRRRIQRDPVLRNALGGEA